MKETFWELIGMERRFVAYPFCQAIVDLDTIGRWIREEWNGQIPRFIFVTAPSADPFVFAIKESYKVAFPYSMPSFSSVDVSNKRFGKVIHVHVYRAK